MIFQGVQTSIDKKSYIFVNFQWCLDSLFLPLDPHINDTVHNLNDHLVQLIA